MKAGETRRRLYSIYEMSDSDIAINASYIRETVLAAHNHIGNLVRYKENIKKKKEKERKSHE